jgi:carboxymethylenebutenolidase
VQPAGALVMPAAERIRFPSVDGDGGGLLFVPEHLPAPGVVLLPAIHSITPYIEEVASGLRRNGFACLALDYFARGDSPELSDRPSMVAAVDAMSDLRAIADVDGALAHLRNGPSAGRSVGVLGFCVGGSLALLARAQIDRLDAVVAYYGQLRYAGHPEHKPTSPLESVGDQGAPFLGHFGDEDWATSIDDAAELARRLRGQPAEVYIYPGAGHAFHEWHRPDVYRATAASESWARTMAFLRWHLGDGPNPAEMTAR